MSTPPAKSADETERGSVTCDECGETHEATYSHEGRYNEGAIYAVVCERDGLTDYYTEERVEWTAIHPRYAR
jgi:hypothetical protein